MTLQLAESSGQEAFLSSVPLPDITVVYSPDPSNLEMSSRSVTVIQGRLAIFEFEVA